MFFNFSFLVFPLRYTRVVYSRESQSHPRFADQAFVFPILLKFYIELFRNVPLGQR
jgi:hypothetical protein